LRAGSDGGSAARFGEDSTTEDLAISYALDGISPLWKIERAAIEQAIAVCDGNIPKAAAMLEISPSTIYRKKMMWDKHSGSSLHC
jgi:DNA-binding NtrC family response regulator